MALATAFQGLNPLGVCDQDIGKFHIFDVYTIKMDVFLSYSPMQSFKEMLSPQQSLLLPVQQKRLSDSSFCGNEKVVILCNSTIHLAVEKALYFLPKIILRSQSQWVASHVNSCAAAIKLCSTSPKGPFSIHHQHMWSYLIFKKLPEEFSLFILSNNSVYSSHQKWFIGPQFGYGPFTWLQKSLQKLYLPYL